MPLPLLAPLGNLARYRIWDCYASMSLLPGQTIRASREASGLEAAAETMIHEMDRFGIETMAPLLRIGNNDDQILRILNRWPKRLIGIATINASNPGKCLEDLDRWVRDGPMYGVFFRSSDEDLVCTHPNFDPIVRRAHELGAAILQHTWFKTGGKDSTGESTPAELAELARRHPDIPFICVHAGGEWEKGIRAIQGCPNVLIETSGFDPTAGFIEMAVRDIGAERVIYGGHYPGRSFGTELSKVIGADITEAEKYLIFGENFRGMLQPIIRRKGVRFS